MIGNTLKDLRNKNHLTQEELAVELGVSRNTISKWESNICMPDTQNLKALCQFFQCNIEDFTGFSYAKTSDVQLKPINREHKSHSSDKSFKKLLIIIMAAEIIFMFCMYIVSQNVTSYKWINQSGNVSSVYSAENTAGTNVVVQEWTEVQEFIPFLRTYHLSIVFAVVVVDVIVISKIQDCLHISVLSISASRFASSVFL